MTRKISIKCNSRGSEIDDPVATEGYGFGNWTGIFRCGHMISFTKVFGIFLFLISIASGGAATAQDAPATATERFAGETQLGSQSPLPVHIELHRSGDVLTGTISIPGASFELGDMQGADPITGRFRGEAGNGPMTLHLDGDVLTGLFDLGGQPGKFTARRTLQDAATFFKPPEQHLDLTTAQWLEDLDRLVAILTREHASPFHRISREEFDREVVRVRASIPNLDGVAVALEFRKLGALIGDGHTSVELPPRPRLPIEFYWFDDGLRVVSVPAVNRGLLGAELIAMNEMTASDVAERLRAYIPQGETQWFYRAGVPNLLNDPDILSAIGIGAGQPVVFTFQMADGARKRLKLAAAAEAGDRATLGDGAPLWRQNETKGFWSEGLADGSVYVNWRSYDGLADQGAALLQSLDLNHPRRLIIDLRDNSGGDYTVGRSFIDGIKSRAWLNRRGVLYVMIGRKTFSAAMTNAVDFKQTTEAILVGEPAGAAPNNWQEVRRFNLPNSALRVGVSTRYYEFLPGKPEVLPDRQISPEPSDWGSPEDASIRFVLAQPVP